MKNDPYLSSWNQTIFLNASQYMNLPPVPYVMDSGNGILDPARQVKQRVKAFSYVYLMTNDTKWLDRVWIELQVGLSFPYLHFIFSHALLERCWQLDRWLGA